MPSRQIHIVGVILILDALEYKSVLKVQLFVVLFNVFKFYKFRPPIDFERNEPKWLLLFCCFTSTENIYGHVGTVS